jgi:hypothetical protein
MTLSIAAACAAQIAADYAAFEVQKNGRPISFGDPLGEFILDPAGTIFGSVCQHGDGVYIVAFRGTSDLHDLNEDRKIKLVANAGGAGRVAQGFAESFAALCAPGLIPLPPADAEIYITGHSLGGVDAVLCAQSFVAQGFHAAHIHGITFASPRPGDQEFADHVHALGLRDWLRYENSADLIPHLPLSLEDLDAEYAPIGDVTVFTASFLDLKKNHALATYQEHIA